MKLVISFNVFLDLLDAKPCKIILQLPQKIISRPEMCKICQKVQIHVQEIHQNPLEIFKNPQSGGEGHVGRGGGCLTMDFCRFPMDLGGCLARGFALSDKMHATK